MTEFTREWIAAQRKYVVDNGCLNDQLCIELLDEIERQAQRIAELEQERQWIPVSEPPKENGRYIIAYEAIWDDLKLHTEYTDFVKKEGRWNALRVKYWQPLPQPPKEGE